MTGITRDVAQTAGAELELSERHAGLDTGTQAGAVKSRLLAFTDGLLLSSFLLVVAMSPFEAGYPPLTRFFRFEFTNLQLMVLAMAGAWLLRLATDGSARARFLKMPLLLPIAALVVATVVSGLFAEYAAGSVGYTVRLLMGVAVFAAAWETLRTTRRLAVTLLTLVGVTLVSSVLGLLEFAPWANIEPWLAAFKPMPTLVAGSVRLSGSFEYANGAAMYYEMILPVVLALATVYGSERLATAFRGPELTDRRRRTVALVLYGIYAVITLALLLTLSRAALAGLGVGLLVMLAAGFMRRKDGASLRLWRLMARSVAVACILTVAAAAYIYLTQPIFRLRLTHENDRSWYTADYVVGEVPALSAGDLVTIPVRVTNRGPMVWRASGATAVKLSYHWRTPDTKEYAIMDGRRTALPHDLGPGESVDLAATLAAPSKAGTYFLEWDLVQENYAWFSVKTGSGSELKFHEVSAAEVHPTRPRDLGQMPRPVSVDTLLDADQATVNRTQLWRVAFRMFREHPLTGVGPDGFRNLYGKYAGVTSWNKNIYTNNTYIEMFTNTGLLGGLAFVALAVMALVRLARNTVTQPTGARWVLAAGVTAATVAFFFHGFADYFLFTTPIFVAFWLFLSISVLWPQMNRREQAAERGAHGAGQGS